MKRKFYRTCAAVTVCLSILCTGFQAFAATSDSYTGYSEGGSLGIAVTCKISGYDGKLFLKDYCTASTEVPVNNIQAAVKIVLYNANIDPIADSGEYTVANKKASVRLNSYDRTSAKHAISAHAIVDNPIYGSFFCLLGSDFE